MRNEGAGLRLRIIAAWGSALLVITAVAAACLLRGLFFAREMYGILAVWFVLCAAVAAAGLAAGGRRSWGQEQGQAGNVGGVGMGRANGAKRKAYSVATRLEGESRWSRRQGQAWSGGGFRIGIISRAKGSICSSATIILGCPLLILALYAVHLLRSPLTVQGTINELLRWGLYASFAFFAFQCAGSRWGARLLAAIWHMLGMAISLNALLTVCGGLPLRFAVAYTASPEVSATGARLGGLFQYPNTFGAVMAVFLLERMFAVAGNMAASGKATNGTDAREGAAGGRAVGEDAAIEIVVCEGAADGVAVGEDAAGGMFARNAARQPLRMLPLFPYAAALLLSESRGALLAAACAAAAALLWKRRLFVPLLAAAAAPVAAAALLYRQLARTGLAVEPLPGLLLLAGYWAGALLAGLWLSRRCRRAAGGSRAAMLMAAALWTAAGTAVLGQLRGRISGPSATVDARGLMYRDAWRLAGEAPWLGRGGETWHSAYLAVQSRPYVGSQVHNGYLDFLLNLGIAGVAVLLLLLLAAVWMTGRNAPRLMPPLLVIILHGVVDFDWSYGLSWLLLFLLLAMARAEPRQQRAAGIEGAAVTGRTPVSVSSPVHPLSGNSATVVLQSASSRHSRLRGFNVTKRVLLLVLLICISLSFSKLSFQMMKGESLYNQAVRNAGTADKITLLRESLAWNPRDPRVAVSLARLLPEEQGRDLLRSSLAYSPQNAGLNWALAGSYMRGSDPGLALYWVRRSLTLDSFNAAKRAKAAAGMLEMGRRNFAKGERQSAEASASAGLELLRQYRLLVDDERSKGPRHNDRGFGFNEDAGKLNIELRQLLAAVNEGQAAAHKVSLNGAGE